MNDKRFEWYNTKKAAEAELANLREQEATIFSKEADYPYEGTIVYIVNNKTGDVDNHLLGFGIKQIKELKASVGKAWKPSASAVGRRSDRPSEACRC